MPEIALSPLQREYKNNANRRWNIKTGATRSGKTWLDTNYMITSRILNVRGKSGLVVLLGNTRGTLERNVIAPMQERFGAGRVSSIRSDNTAELFGERVFCLGADNKKHVDRLRGSSIKYCYGDEVVTWNAEVFEMLKSRLDKPYSKFDGTCNPAGPNHWFKKFLDSDADIFQQSYCLEDNPFLSRTFVENLKREYAGTVYYDRYIRGLWVSAEGAIYRPWCDRRADFVRSVGRDDIIHTVIGVDFGGNGSAHAFILLGILRGFRGIAILKEYYRKEILTPDQLESDFVDFAAECVREYGTREARCDSAEKVLIQGLRAACIRNGVYLDIKDAIKGPINNRIRFTLRMMGRGAFFVDGSCTHLMDALTEAVYDSKSAATDRRLDDGTTNIDSLDAMEYAFEPYMADIVEIGGMKA